MILNLHLLPVSHIGLRQVVRSALLILQVIRAYPPLAVALMVRRPGRVENQENPGWLHAITQVFFLGLVSAATAFSRDTSFREKTWFIDGQNLMFQPSPPPACLPHSAPTGLSRTKLATRWLYRSIQLIRRTRLGALQRWSCKGSSDPAVALMVRRPGTSRDVHANCGLPGGSSRIFSRGRYSLVLGSSPGVAGSFTKLVLRPHRRHYLRAPPTAQSRRARGSA